MKKKVVAVCATVALAAVAFGGATLAYFTDQDQVKNNFTIGDISIDLWENTGAVDDDGNPIKEQVGKTYEGLMPTNEVTKKPVIENTGENEAYVRVAVVMNNVGTINDAIDKVYEGLGYTEAQIQAVYDDVFNGWGMSYIKRNVDGNNDRRLWMHERTTDTCLLFDGQIDMYCAQPGNGSMYDVKNHFKSETDTNEEGFDYANAGYYHDSIATDQRIYVFYLKLDKGESYTLFNGLNVPADFSNARKTVNEEGETVIINQMAMFDDLKIDVYADAIQTVGFTTPDEAFAQLQKEHPLGWWNN